MRKILLTILVIAMSSAVCLAQTVNGTILGHVTDASGFAVQGANVAILNTGTGLNESLTTDKSGSFISPTLPLGTYEVTVSAKGFETQVKSGLVLNVADRMQLLYTLKPGNVSTTVKVTTHAPLIETASTTLGAVISSQQVASLPVNGRSVTDLLILVPGVSMLGGANQQSVGGVGTFSNEGGVHFLVDGGDASRVDYDDLTNQYGSSAGRISRVSMDAVQEFRVSTDLYSAEYGATQGGSVNLITKSGTNDMHGSLFEYFRNNIFDARDYFDAPPTNQPAYRLNQFGGSVGGPVIHNRMFYFGDYEGVRQRTGNILRAIVPTAAARAAAVPVIQTELAQLPLPNGPITSDPNFGNYTIGVTNPLTENTYMGKIDYMMSNVNHLSGRINVNKNLTDTYTGVATGQIQSAPGIMVLAMLDDTYTITPKLLNDATFNYNRFHVDPLSSPDENIRNEPIVNYGEGAGTGPGLFNILIANNSFTYQDIVTWVHNHQQIKFGGNIIRNQVNKELGFQMIATFQTFAQAQQNQAFQDSTLGFPRFGLRNTYYDMFFQDDYQLRPRLTLNLGLRYQYDTTFQEAHGKITNFDFSTDALTPIGDNGLDFQKLNFAPRIGIAYSMNSAGTTVLRAGFGIFYTDQNAGNDGQGLPSNVPGNGFTASVSYKQVPGLVGLPFPDLSSFGVPSTSFSAIQRNLATPYSEKWSLNIQQALGQSAMLQVGYSGNHGVHLFESIDANRFFPGTNVRPLPQYGSISTLYTGGFSNYDALQAIFKKRWNNGMAFHANYTWSHTLDDTPTVFSSIQDDHNPQLDYSNTDFDVRHNFEADVSYQIPAAPRIPKIIGSGWQFNDITQIRSGFYYSVSCGCDPLSVGQLNGLADSVPGVNRRPTDYNIPFNQLNPAAFVAPVGHIGNSGRNSNKGPAAMDFDMSAFKTFTIVGQQKLEFRAEAFNIFNHPQFSSPGAALNNLPQFGQSLSTITTDVGFHTSRQLQFALRYFF